MPINLPQPTGGLHRTVIQLNRKYCRPLNAIVAFPYFYLVAYTKDLALACQTILKVLVFIYCSFNQFFPSETVDEIEPLKHVSDRSEINLLYPSPLRRVM